MALALAEDEHEDTTPDDLKKILGIWWAPTADYITFSLRYNRIDGALLSSIRAPTKRDVLRVLMSLFDPIGLLAYYTVHLKILMQEIWRTGRNWDESIAEGLIPTWVQWIRQLRMVEDIQIPRCFLQSVADYEGAVVEIHVFCDASEEAYCAVAYLRIEKGNCVDVAFLAAKTKVAPLKLVSVPRLELMAALIGARLGRHLERGLSIPVTRRCFYTDSTTALGWVLSTERRFKQFVAFRVAEIPEITAPSEWFWIESKENVADEATK